MDKSAFSYADVSDPFWKRAAIGVVETATGRNRLRRLYFDRQRAGWDGRGFFATSIAALSLDLRYDAAKLDALPKTGPLVVVANHPFGVLDGIVLCALMERVRADVRALTNAVLLRAPEMRATLLPIDFSETGAARRANAASRAAALRHLCDGGCVVIFPAGAVSTAPDRLGRRPAVDGPWTPFVAKLVLAASAPVAPVYFPGQNSRLFQVASHISQTLRLALLFHEVRRRVGSQFPVEIGDVIPFAALEGEGDRHVLTALLRARVAALASVKD